MFSLAELPRWVFEIGFFAYIIIASGVVVLERRRPTATLALLLTLAFLPVIGLLAYWLFSRRRVRKRRRLRQRRVINPVDGTRNVANVDELPADLPTRQRGLVRLALQTSAAPLRRADTVELLPTAKQAFDAVVAAIAEAKVCIHLEFYIWRDDDTGNTLVGLLAARAREGIRVRILYDQMGSLGVSKSHFAPLLEAGGQVAVFGPVRFPLRLRRSRLNFRNHRKIITVDAKLGFVGGLNVGDEYFGSKVDDSHWRDLFVSMRGDAALGLEAIFLEDWLATTGEVLDLAGGRPRSAEGIDGRKPPGRRRPWRRRQDRQALQTANPFAPLPDTPMRSAGPLVQVIPSGPDIPVASAIAAQFSAAIAAADQRAWIATPYLVPDEPLTLILRTAALRGVDVRILVPTPSKNDQRLVALASQSYYDELLEAGCRIFEYQPGMLHAKYLIVDEVSAIGSANMDVRSFHINYEVTAMFYDISVTSALARVFATDLARASAVKPIARLGLPLHTRLAESFARILSPLL